jgi:hypothetical protein
MTSSVSDGAPESLEIEPLAADAEAALRRYDGQVGGFVRASGIEAWTAIDIDGLLERLGVCRVVPRLGGVNRRIEPRLF